MNFLIIDGNSILNRAFYGIKLLSTKDGRFTNGIQGFLNIFLRLKEECSPDAVAVAFDLPAKTFRHKLYDGYKAKRKGMPEELAQQLPVLKQLLTLMGYKIVECEGYEADDIVGTLSFSAGAEGVKCFIATGDRDSLQLVTENTNVLLASTKMGKPQTVKYDIETINEEYGVSPEGLIEIKALMGDSSDNIPGVAGVGQKTATDLIIKFDTIDKLYEQLDKADIKQGVKDKLLNDRDMAFLSRTLGTINKEAPVETEIECYIPKEPDSVKCTALLADLEMFKITERLKLPAQSRQTETESVTEKTVKAIEEFDLDALLDRLTKNKAAYFICGYSGTMLTEAVFYENGQVTIALCGQLAFPSFMKSLLENEFIKKYTHGIKKLFSHCLMNGIHMRNISMDTEIAGYILNPSSGSYGLDRLVNEYAVPLKNADKDEYSPLCSLPELCEKMKKEISRNNQERLLLDIEIPLAEVLASMELYGFFVDEDGISEFGRLLQNRIEKISAEIFESIGYEFNLNSPKQLGEALFDKLNLPHKKKTKSGYSTSAEVLEELAYEHPAVVKILEYRTLSKLKSTYCDGLLKAVSADGRIHSTLNQTETRTGRISSTEPNLQNIPVRSELGREMRKYFAAKSGYTLVDADYSQIELRVLAHVASDDVMIEAFNNNYDIHTITASQVFNMPVEMVTPLMRSRAKAVNFGIVYGIGAFSLSKDIGVTRAEADKYIKGYLSHYSGVREYMDMVVMQARIDGYAETIYNRRRYLPELTASNANLRNFGERVARNMPIHGAAADIINIAMIKVYKRLREEGLKSRLIMQVHDELIVEAPLNEAEKAAEILKTEMENAAELKVKLSADVHCGRTWYEAKEG